MLKKMFKTILVLSLCIGVVLPTNAAVSVSDGSAFVTKAEFAADLNNLSNRMAQLENSLDAKIDSLVSSYLTRNGIWNGAKQDCEGQNVEFDGYDDFVTEVAALKTINKSVWSFSTTMNKAGMLFIQLDCSLSKGNDIKWRNYLRSETSYVGYDSYRYLHFKVSSGTETLYDNSIINSDCTVNSKTSSYDSLQYNFPTSGTYIIQCFVAKDTVNFELIDTWINSHNSFTFKTLSGYGFWVGGGILKYTIAKAVIY